MSSNQSSGRLGTEALANEQGTQRSPTIFNNSASGKAMDPWKKDMMSFLAQRSPVQQQAQVVSPQKTSKTLYGAADPSVPGGPKEVQTQQQAGQQNQALPANNQSVANPVAAQHNPPPLSKGGSMNTQRVETVRALLKFAACMKKSICKKRMRKKAGEGADVPSVSAAAPLAAAGVGGGAGALATALHRRADPELASLLPKLLHYPRNIAAGAALAAAPVLAGADAAKEKGGAGRGAAHGALLGGLLGPLTHHNPLIGVAGGAGLGAIGGAIGGGAQKHRREKYQAKAKSEKKKTTKAPEKKEKSEKEAALRGVLKSSKKVDLQKVASFLKDLPWSKLMGLGALGVTGAAVVPPALRALNRGVEHYFDPAARQAYELQQRMMPQMAMLNMMRAYGPYGMGGGMYPPPLMPEDREIMNHASYLQGLRSRARSMREAFDA